MKKYLWEFEAFHDDGKTMQIKKFDPKDLGSGRPYFTKTMPIPEWLLSFEKEIRKSERIRVQKELKSLLGLESVK